MHAANSRRLLRTAAASFSEMFMIPVSAPAPLRGKA